MRLRSDIWVAAYLRRCAVEGAYATLRRRGAPEAGAIFILVDRLDGNVALFAPAPQSEIDEDAGRSWVRAHSTQWVEPGVAEEKLKKEAAFDPDLWIVDVEDRQGRCFLNLSS